VQFLGGGGPASQDQLSQDAFVALLDMIKSPVIILSHSQGGAAGWLIADSRPNQVKGIVTLEPAAPPIKNVDTAKIGLQHGRGWRAELGRDLKSDPLRASRQGSVRVAGRARREIGYSRRSRPLLRAEEPAHKLVNLGKIPVVYLSAEGGYHREYDHCLAKWLNQAGVKTQFVRMEDVGLKATATK